MTITKILPFTLMMAVTALSHQVHAASEDAPTQGAYVTDEQRFYVEGQSVTEVIETANSLVCYISNMRPDALISDGAYQAKVYEERCVTTGADATAEQASASATSSQSSTTASSGSGAAEIDTETALISTVVVEPIALNPEDPFKPQPMRAIGWVDDKAASADEFDTRSIWKRISQLDRVRTRPTASSKCDGRFILKVCRIGLRTSLRKQMKRAMRQKVCLTLAASKV